MSSTTSRETRRSHLTTNTFLTLPTEQVEDLEKPGFLREKASPSHRHHNSQTGRPSITQTERHAAILFSDDHLKHIIETPPELLKFTAFLKYRRPESLPVLVYYLDVLKALNAVAYANAVLGTVGNVAAPSFTASAPRSVLSPELEDRAASAFRYIVEEDLPAYITQTAINYVASSLKAQATSSKLWQHSHGFEDLAEMFFLTDPTKPENPIVFASDAFERYAAYNEGGVHDHSIRVLQGPSTTNSSIRRIEEACRNGHAHCDVVLCYSRKGTLFLGLLMISPLCDSRGKIRYYLGALNDISNFGEVFEDLDSFQSVLQKRKGHMEDDSIELGNRDYLKELSEMFNISELLTVQRWGGRLHGDYQSARRVSLDRSSSSRTPVLASGDRSEQPCGRDELLHAMGPRNIRAPYQDYVLLRPFPSLRILFASPSLRLAGVLQSPFLSRIGGSRRVREGLTGALAKGHCVTAKIRWTIDPNEEEQTRWIYCTPLRGHNGRIGVWMVLLLEDVKKTQRRHRESWAQPRKRSSMVVDGNWNGVLWREHDDTSDDDRPRTSHRVSNRNSWADFSSFRSYGTEDASSMDSGSRFNLRVH